MVWRVEVTIASAKSLRLEMVLTADGRGVVQMVAASAWMVMAVRRLYCGKDPIAPVLGKIEGLRRESVVCWGRLTGLRRLEE
ncbi:hypothetical protein RHGRI_020984 [Rhododendron griersonianum]|uniref:Uncharacterized protein n=1 Tax=Rhododendron griersonianum TaxID=479676 RepID=A0AAV6JJR7_9ERIC|nr:hypothetical protein RHGRI_020984 [Rhododendron griersonianum]